MSAPNIKADNEHRQWLWFDADLWPNGRATEFETFVEETGGEVFGGGRGTVRRFQLDGQPMIHRHYLRGGMVASLLSDRYLFQGSHRTRSAQEFALMADMYGANLPVPRPVAAHARQDGLWYRANLVTCEVENTHTLAQAVIDGSDIDWSAIGRTISRFHRWGLDHADLNAHNILMNDEGNVFLIDFDRGQRRARGKWAQGNLQRLHRSLIKLGAENRIDRFAQSAWRVLRQGYES